ncbi:carboxypeptidase B-like [Mya arenaria]|uniref:carboxypeptidase B-like n=1 Tax=Mya arenaria TaxID=6604 RepID=UPI0022E3EC67|nr:carboxypeptidase B-like [Mya arenaria]
MMDVYFIIFLGLSAVGAAKNYDGYLVFKIKPEAEGQVEKLCELLKDMRLDVWKEGGIGQETHVMVNPELLEKFLHKMQKNDLQADIMISDVGALERAERKAMEQGSESASFDYSTYHSLAEIEAWMTDFAANAPSGIDVTKIKIGESFQGRDLSLLKVERNPSATKPNIIMIFGSHGREWISPATALNFLNYLVSEASALNTYCWHIVPVSNPDSYYRTTDAAGEEKDRLWRKTVSSHSITVNNGTKTLTCSEGVDFDRNFERMWVGYDEKAGPDCSSQTFSGLEPWSETEVQAIRDYVISTNVAAFVDIHSYGEMVLLPYAYTTTRVPHFDELMELGTISASAIESIDGNTYAVGQIPDLLAKAHGLAIDWTCKDEHILFSFAYALRDKGEFGFLLPRDQIQIAGEEFIAGVMAMVNGLP